MPDKFITKDSGERAVFSTGMQRDTQDDKPRFDLIFPLDMPYELQVFTRLAKLMARGAIKYDARNREKAKTMEEYERFKASCRRHFVQYMAGETDEDHMAAVIFNLQGMEYCLYQINKNNE